jgi:cell division topological specificity factor
MNLLTSFVPTETDRVGSERASTDHRGARARPAQHPDYLPALQKELVEVIRKYVNIGNDDVHRLENQGSCSILELNITLPDR